MTVPSDSGVRVTTDSERNERRIRDFHKAMNVMVEPLQNFELTGFFVKTSKSVQWKCVLLLVSYCFDVPESKNMSAVRYGVVVKRSCVGYMLTGDDIIGDEMAGERSVWETEMIRSHFLEI